MSVVHFAIFALVGQISGSTMPWPKETFENHVCLGPH